MLKGFAKGLTLLIITNLLVMVAVSVVTSALTALGILPPGIIGQSAVLSLVWGFGIAFMSLFMSKISAKWMTGAQVIDPSAGGSYAWLVNMVHQQAKDAGLPKMPEVAVYQSPELNAFATGPTRSNSLVAFSSGILQSMSRDEIEGVSAHEVSHIANGDMIAMTLLQGLANAFVIFFSRLVAKTIADRMDSEGGAIAVYMITNIVAQMVFMLLASIPLNWFSRRREYRADAGSAKLSGKEKMIAALSALDRYKNLELPDEARVPEAVAALAITNNRSSFLQALFSTHPPLDARIKALREL